MNEKTKAAIFIILGIILVVNPIGRTPFGLSIGPMTQAFFNFIAGIIAIAFIGGGFGVLVMSKERGDKNEL